MFDAQITENNGKISIIQPTIDLNPGKSTFGNGTIFGDINGYEIHLSTSALFQTIDEDKSRHYVRLINGSGSLSEDCNSLNLEEIFSSPDVICKVKLIASATKLDNFGCIYPSNQPKCVPNWNATYGNCLANKTQTVTYVDTNNCNDASAKPLDKTQNCTPTSPTSQCVPHWSCTYFSDCSDEGTQTRTCTDTNKCNITANKPEESRSCTLSQATTETTPTQDNTLLLLIIAIIALIVVVALAVYFKRRKPPASQPPNPSSGPTSSAGTAPSIKSRELNLVVVRGIVAVVLVLISGAYMMLSRKK
jgi:hypothetical protein